MYAACVPSCFGLTRQVQHSPLEGLERRSSARLAGRPAVCFSAACSPITRVWLVERSRPVHPRTHALQAAAGMSSEAAEGEQSALVMEDDDVQLSAVVTRT